MSIVEKYLDRIKECERDMFSDGSPCIYRGEPGCYPRVSSSLYRYYEERYEDLWGKVNESQKGKILKGAEAPEGQTLGKKFAKIQLLGGKTNWIDFTDDPRVALFFACFGQGGVGDEKGRIIVASESCFCKDNINRPRSCYGNPLQSNVLVRSNSGVIDINNDNVRRLKVPFGLPTRKHGLWVDIWSEKCEILDGLKADGIFLESLYDGYNGYIRFQEWYLPPLAPQVKKGREGDLEGKESNHRSGYAWGVYVDEYFRDEPRYKIVCKKTREKLYEGNASQCMDFLQKKIWPGKFS